MISRRKLRVNKNKDALSAINLTSLMDLMCVLLIVFIVATPVLFASVSINLPDINSKIINPSEVKYIEISFTKDLEIYIENDKINSVDLLESLTKVSQGNKDISIFFKADSQCNYGSVISLISLLNSYGYRNISLLGKYKKDLI
jgi:biopolymer transport protein ExbD